MSFDPRDYAAVADTLRAAADENRCPPDAARRAAIGRYYYAALLATRDFITLTEPMPTDTTEATHGWVIGKLRASIDPESQRLTSELNSMRVTRNAADYGDEVRDLAGTATRMAGAAARAIRYVGVLERRYRR